MKTFIATVALAATMTTPALASKMPLVIEECETTTAPGKPLFVDKK